MTTAVRWRRSTRSQNGSSCVELANTLDAVRDSKNPTTAITVPTPAMINAIRQGHFDR